jgi:hypothetical protein
MYNLLANLLPRIKIHIWDKRSMVKHYILWQAVTKLTQLIIQPTHRIASTNEVIEDDIRCTDCKAAPILSTYAVAYVIILANDHELLLVQEAEDRTRDYATES